MSRGPTARSIAVCDQLIAILRAEWPLPIATGQLLLRMANDHQNCNRPFNMRGHAMDGKCAFTPVESCRAWCWYDPVYPQLQRLLKRDIVERIRLDHHRQVFWRLAAEPTDEDMNRLLAQLDNA